MKEELHIRYTIEGRIDSSFDTALVALAKQHDWHFWASGFSHITGERGLAFDRLDRTPNRLIATSPVAFELDSFT